MPLFFWLGILGIILNTRSGLSASENIKHVAVEAGRNVTLKCAEEKAKYVGLPFGPFGVKWKLKHDQGWSKILTNGDDITIQVCTGQKVVECGDVNILSTLKLFNLSSSDSGIYTCYLIKKKSEQRIQKTRLTVGYAPQEPWLILDDSTMDFKTNVMTFCWDTRQPTRLNTTYEITKHSSKCRRTNPLCVCCGVKVDNMFEWQKIALRATNEYGVSTSEEHQIVPSRHIKPPPPTDLVLKPEVVQNINDVLVTWKKPEMGGFLEFDYRIIYSEAKPTKIWTTEYGSTETQHRIENLKSSTLYVVRVAAKPDNSDGVYDGVWSEWSVSASMRTGISVPSKRFAALRPNATLVRFGGRTHYTINLVWHPYEYQQEDGFYNLISCGNCSDIEDEFKVSSGNRFTYDTSSLKVCCEGAYCNDAGCSKKQSIKISLPRAKKEIQTARSLSLNETHLAFRWDGYTGKGSCSARVCWKARNGSDHSENEFAPYDKCLVDGFLTWRTYDVNCLEGDFALKDRWNPCYSYLIVVEVHLRRERATVKSQASSRIQYEEHFKQSEGLTFSVSGDSQIVVTWSNRVATCGFMTRQIRYQPSGGAECDEHFGTTCRPMYHTVPCNATKVVISENVYGGQMYSVEKVASCPEVTKKSGETGAVMRTISADAVYVSTPVQRPEGSPYSLRLAAYSSANPDLLWEPPLHPNGLVHYEISSRKVSASTSEETITSFTTTNLREQVDISCIPGYNNTVVSFSVTPYTISEENHTYFYGENATISGVACVLTEESHFSSTVVIFIVVGCIALLAASLAGIFCYYHRKKIRTKVKSKMWTEVPRPIVKGSVEAKEIATYSTHNAVVGNKIEPCSLILGQAENSDSRPHLVNPEQDMPKSSEKIDVLAPPGDSARYVKTTTVCPSPSCDVEYAMVEVVDNTQPQAGELQLRRKQDVLAEGSKIASTSTSTSDDSASSNALKQYVRMTQGAVTLLSTNDQCVARGIHSENSPTACPRCSSLDEDVEYVTETSPLVDESDSCRNCGMNQAPGRRSREGSDAGGSGHKVARATESGTSRSTDRDAASLSNVETKLAESSEEGYVEDMPGRDDEPSIHTFNASPEQTHDFLENSVFGQESLWEEEGEISRNFEKSDYLKNGVESMPKESSRGSHSSGIQEDLEDIDFETGNFLDGSFSTPNKHKIFLCKSDTKHSETLKVAGALLDSDDASYVDIETAGLIPA